MSGVVFWLAAGGLTLVAVVLITRPLLRKGGSETPTDRLSRIRFAASVAALVVVGAVGLYRILGQPEASVGDTHPVPGHPAVASDSVDAAAAPVDVLTTRLAERLSKAPDDPKGWMLLARSYQHLGRVADANAALDRALAAGMAAAEVERERSALAESSADNASGSDASLDITALEAKTRAQPTDDMAWATLGRRYAALRRWPEAKAALQRATELAPRSADHWVDFADATAAFHDGDLSHSSKLIARALALDPNHTKALWLQGSLDFQRGKFGAALVIWKRLAALLQPGSGDAQAIAANVAQCERLVGAQPSVLATSTAGAASPGGASVQSTTELRGRVELGSKWRDKIKGTETLFIFAKTADRAGPPLAVLRTSTKHLPLDFVLNDAMAMLPAHKLSDFRDVIVEARISRSGTADARKGDPHAMSAVVHPRDGKPVRLIINEEVS